MTNQIEWFLVDSPEDGRIGALGFLGDVVSVVALFDAGADPAQVISAARNRPEVFTRDPGIAQLATQGSGEFPRSLPLDISWSNYFRPGVAMETRGADRIVHGSAIARIAPRRGEELAIEAAISA
ncbi:MAG: hypothetical protein DI616_01880 [Paracoccus denitrificans]|uniref:Uncharacterized protein n=1 Tax=Paracoccus denitrificans TaxID=266 RepID=A0A533ID10_PARDE|nr:MAG: hypothetical protein DI616_01880 [Paracoccus denitrificans]